MTKKTLSLILVLASILTLTSCTGNADMAEGFTNESNTFTYVVAYEAGHYRLHGVQKWADSGYGALGITTNCCNNMFWTSFNVSILYRYKPDYLLNDVDICAGVR